MPLNCCKSLLRCRCHFVPMLAWPSRPILAMAALPAHGIGVSLMGYPCAEALGTAIVAMRLLPEEARTAPDQEPRLTGVDF